MCLERSMPGYSFYLNKKTIKTCENEISAPSLLGDGKATIGADFGNGPCEGSCAFPPFRRRISKLPASCSTATNCYPVLMDRLPQPTDQTTHRRQITSLTAVATHA